MQEVKENDARNFLLQITPLEKSNNHWQSLYNAFNGYNNNSPMVPLPHPPSISVSAINSGAMLVMVTYITLLKEQVTNIPKHF